MTTQPTIFGKIHCFEEAGLGKAPFHLHHVTVGNTHCQYCGTPILYQFHIEGSDGSLFYVGSDCVQKTGDIGLIKVVDREVKKHERELRQKREEARLTALQTKLADEAIRKELASKPHPFVWQAKMGKTLLDYYEFCVKFGGKSAKLKVARQMGC